MTVAVTRTADHTVAVATLLSAVDGSSNVILPTYLVTSTGTEIGTAASPAYVAPGTNTTWAISAVSLPLPAGAATAAKQPALGTAGTASSDVITVQGIASMVALKVDGSGVTQPVSGTVTATGPLTDTQLRASAVPVSDGGGSITVDGSVSVSGSVAVTGTFWQATQPVSIASAVAVTDNSGSLTVDAPVGTPVYVRLSDGTAAITTLPVSLASVPSHAVTNAGTFAVQVDGTALTKLTDIETNTDSGAVVGNGAAATAQRVTLASDSTGIVALTTSTASIGKLAANSTGVLIGQVELAASQTLSTVTTVSTVTTCSTVTTLSGGGVAHDGIDSGNPVKIGGKAVSTQSGQTAVASADRSDLIQDLDGTVIERPHTHGDMVSGAASTTGTSDTSAVAAQGASTYFYCTGWSIANTGSTATLITFKDGSGGAALGYTVAPASGGSNYSAGGKPLFRTSANTALYFACGSASTTVYVTVYGYKSKV